MSYWRTVRKPSHLLDELEDDDDDLEEGEERIHGKSTSPGPSVKFSDENLYKKGENEGNLQKYLHLNESY